MASYKNEQRRLHYRGRDFHFVSYDAVPADERRDQEAVPSMWYLMNEGKRWPVIPHVAGQDLEELDEALLQWVSEEIFRARARQRH